MGLSPCQIFTMRSSCPYKFTIMSLLEFWGGKCDHSNSSSALFTVCFISFRREVKRESVTITIKKHTQRTAALKATGFWRPL